MADADLFMECEEEELEPWQQMNDDVEDEEVSIVDSKDSTGTYSLATTPPAVSSGAVSGFTATQMTTSSAIPSSDTKTVPVLGNTQSPVSSMLPPTVVQAAVPSLVSPGLPKAAPAQQLILTQSPGSMGTVAVPQVLQPVQVVPSAVPGTSAATNQPIFITTQGFPVRSTRPIQNPVNPLGIVLNVQQGQTVRPITLVSAPGTQFFKPAMGVQQVVSQPAHIRPGAPAVARPPTSNYTTVQIPATLTIRSSTPLTQQGVTTFANMAASTVTQPVHSSVLAQPPQAKVGFQALATGGSRRILMQGGRVLDVQEGDRANLCKVMPEKPGEPEVQKLGNVVNVVTSPTTGKPQSLQIVVSQASSNGLNATVPAVTSKSPLDSIKVGPATSIPDSKICPRCGAEFRMIEALRGHMCFCCPQLTQDLSDTKSPQSKSLSGSTVTHSALSLPPQPKPQPSQKAITPPVSILEGPSSGTNSESKLIMLVDDFYYGCHEGNCTQTPQDTLREPMLFKCLSCSKKLKNNIRLMNHMKHHVELEQQSGEVDTHTYCQHCYRQFPTPFQLQCHLESVHSHYESSTKCKICEWAFESEPVFLQHMKNTHKPGEMPYVCQVCDYRSSFYLDVYNHFRTWHEDTRHLLCLYCLKVFKNSNSYQQHFIRHQKKSVYHCNKCRLQFLFTKDKIEHKLNHHKTFRKPEQLEGLQPGTKVTIRAYAVQNRTTGMVPVIPPGAHIPPDRDTPSPHVGEVTHHQTHNGNKQNQPHPPVKKKSVSKMLELLTKFQEQREMVGKQTCLECNFDVPDFPNHYPTYVHCSLCRYSTCCSRAYANHMINNHIPRKSTKYLALYRKPVPSWMKMTCVTCKYTTQVGDLMAKHLAQNLSHCYSLCTPKGSPKVGFVMESPRYKLPQNESGSSCQPSTRLAFPAMHLDSAFQSNQTMMSKEPCQEMETVEDKGLGKDGETEAVPQKVQEDTNMKEISRSVEPKTVSSLPSVATAKFVTDATGTLKEREETLSVRQLRIVLFALCCGISQAAEHFNTQPQLIEAWLLEKKRQIHREGCTTAGVSGEAVDRLVEWVLAQREQQLPVNEKNLFQKASEIHSQANQSSSFRISYEWAVGFMLQHDLGLQVTDTVSRHLPCNAEENAQAFTEFVHKQIEIQSFSPSVICAMDELSVFIDLDVLANPLSVGKEFAFQLVGTGESLCDIFLAMLADGTVLPTMVFFKGQLPGRLRIGLPDSVLLEAKVEGFSEEEELELWISQVWQKHVNSQGGNKAMLILDSFRSHMLEDSLAAISAVNTLPTVIPIGCTCRLQPLEMCLKPVLQHFLQARWTQLASQGGAAGASPKDLVQLLVAWLVESLATFAAQPKLLQRSFHVAQVYPFTEEEQSPADAQKELILTLTEVLMGPERLGPKSATPKETVEKQGTDKDKMKLSDDRKVVGDQGSTNTIKEAKDEKGGMTKPKNVGVHGKKNVLGKSEFSAMSPSHMPTANPQVLHQIFDKDSDAESFHGFDDTEIYAEINS
uniref:Pogo transposable element derived with ZNF domain b n=1 Tax=Scleropages formosus TaxID=113540 RepID=A0A8C9RJY5_SCLFO